MTDTSGADPMVQSFFWGDATQGLTLDQLKARRAVAAAMASRSRPYPTTIGQGLTAFGEGLGQGIYERNLNIAEARQRALDVQELQRSKKPSEASPPAGASSGAAGSADAAATGAFGLGSPSTNAAVADSGPDIKDEMANTILARQGVLPGSAPMQRTRMAALDTGTVSDAGSPGLTYGGAPAGPGASMMEPPTTAPPAPTAPSVAANAAAQQPAGPAGTPVPGVVGGGQGSGGPAGPPAPVGADAVAGSVLAQIGAGAPVPKRPPPPPAPPAAVPQQGDVRVRSTPPYGQPTEPTTDLGPGGVRMEPSRPPPPTPAAPQRVDTPEMIQNRAVRNDPRMLGRRSESVLQQMDQEYLKMKEDRDKAFERATEQWQKDRDFKLEWAKQHREHVISQPKVQQELQKAQDEAYDRIRFGSAENKQLTIKNAKESADKAKTLADSLPNLYKAMDILKNKTIVAGVGAQTSPLAINTPIGNVGMPSNLTWQGIAGSMGFKGSREAVENTQEFRALMRPMVKSMLQQTTGAGAISNAEVEQAMEGLGIAGNLEKPAMIKIIENLRENAYRTIQDHNAKLNQTFNDPRRDEVIHKDYKVSLPPDPHDVMMLRAVPNSPQERARFDSLYGPGAAARELGYGR